MTVRRIILEMGSGVDQYGEDYTKAAKRAVFNTLQNAAIPLFRNLGISPEKMQIDLKLGAQEPDKIDLDAVAAELPYGTVTASAEKGGLNVPDPEHGVTTIVVNAAVVVRLPLGSET